MLSTQKTVPQIHPICQSQGWLPVCIDKGTIQADVTLHKYPGEYSFQNHNIIMGWGRANEIMLKFSLIYS